MAGFRYSFKSGLEILVGFNRGVEGGFDFQ